MASAAARPIANFHPNIWGDRFINYTPNYEFLNHLKMTSLPQHLPTSVILASAAARPIANFHPNIWGDRFINYTPNYEETSAKKQEHESLKSEVRREFIRAVDPMEQLELIDVIERLGIAYHFEKQIESSLSKIYGDRHFHTLNLYHASLAFRILRQHGYDVSSDVFLKFTDDQGNFSEISDAKALLSLYEAAYLRGNGEEVLENAVVFTTSSLKLIAAQKIHPLASRISRALAFPIHRRVIRIESRYYLSSYEQDPSHNASLLRFAKLDFILLQSLHKEELQELIKWWRSFDFSKTLPFIRDRVVEAYFFSVGVYYEPKYSVARKIYTKAFMILTICDDIYDSYGSLEELTMFTEAIGRWEKGSASQLPKYMNLFYEIQYDTYKQFEDDLAKLGRRNHVHYVVKELINVSRWYLQEATWRELKYIPTYDEYFENGIRSIACATMVMVSFLDNELDETVANKAFESVSGYCKPQRATCVIARLNNDLGDHKYDKHRDHVVGAVDCYMKQHGVSEEEARAAIDVAIENAWKDLNEEIFRPVTQVPRPLLSHVYNFCRAVEYVYRNEDGFTVVSQRVKDAIHLLFIEPLSV